MIETQKMKYVILLQLTVCGFVVRCAPATTRFQNIWNQGKNGCSNPCENVGANICSLQGVCVRDGCGWNCRCYAGYTGKFCEERVFATVPAVNNNKKTYDPIVSGNIFDMLDQSLRDSTTSSTTTSKTAAKTTFLSTAPTSMTSFLATATAKSIPLSTIVTVRSSSVKTKPTATIRDPSSTSTVKRSSASATTPSPLPVPYSTTLSIPTTLKTSISAEVHTETTVSHTKSNIGIEKPLLQQLTRPLEFVTINTHKQAGPNIVLRSPVPGKRESASKNPSPEKQDQVNPNLKRKHHKCINNITKVNMVSAKTPRNIVLGAILQRSRVVTIPVESVTTNIVKKVTQNDIEAKGNGHNDQTQTQKDNGSRQGNSDAIKVKATNFTGKQNDRHQNEPSQNMKAAIENDNDENSVNLNDSIANKTTNKIVDGSNGTNQNVIIDDAKITKVNESHRNKTSNKHSHSENGNNKGKNEISNSTSTENIHVENTSGKTNENSNASFVNSTVKRNGEHKNRNDDGEDGSQKEVNVETSTRGNNKTTENSMDSESKRHNRDNGENKNSGRVDKNHGTRQHKFDNSSSNQSKSDNGKEIETSSSEVSKDNRTDINSRKLDVNSDNGKTASDDGRYVTKSIFPTTDRSNLNFNNDRKSLNMNSENNKTLNDHRNVTKHTLHSGNGSFTISTTVPDPKSEVTRNSGTENRGSDVIPKRNNTQNRDSKTRVSDSNGDNKHSQRIIRHPRKEHSVAQIGRD